MKILVTRAAKFIGFYVSKILLNKGHEVVGLDNINEYYDVNLKYARLKELGINKKNASSFHALCSSDNNHNFSFIRMNLEDRLELPKLFIKQNMALGDVQTWPCFYLPMLITNNRPIKVFNHGYMERDFTYIDDFVEGVVRVIEKQPVKRIKNSHCLSMA